MFNGAPFALASGCVLFDPRVLTESRVESVKMRTSPDDLGGNYDLNLFMESRDGQWLSVD